MDLFAVLKFARAVQSVWEMMWCDEIQSDSLTRSFHNPRNVFLNVVSLQGEQTNGDFDVNAQ